MTNEEKKQYRKKHWKTALIGFVGFMLLFTAVGIEDDRVKMPAKDAQELASPKATFAMGASGMALILGATLWAKKRDNQR